MEKIPLGMRERGQLDRRHGVPECEQRMPLHQRLQQQGKNLARGHLALHHATWGIEDERIAEEAENDWGMDQEVLWKTREWEGKEDREYVTQEGKWKWKKWEWKEKQEAVLNSEKLSYCLKLP